MHALFGALPSARLPDYNAVYAFDNNTFLELLGPVNDEHTRARFLRKFGPGFYMICSTLEGQDEHAVEEELKCRGKRIVRSMQHKNIRKTWHIHPQDSGGFLTLLAVKTDMRDNREWCGEHYHAYIRGNTRYVDEVGGVLARTVDPAAEAPIFAPLGFAMTPAGDGAWKWVGRGGTVFELWPADAWVGERANERVSERVNERLDDRRDYAICLRTRHLPALLERFAACGLTGIGNVGGVEGRRWLSSTDPVLGVRFAVEQIPTEREP